MGAVPPLAGAEKVQSAGAVWESCPGCRGEAEGRTETILTLAGVRGYTVDLSRLSQGGVLESQQNRALSHAAPTKLRDVTVFYI